MPEADANRQRVRASETPFIRAMRELLSGVEATFPEDFEGIVDCYLVGGCAVHLYTKYRVSGDINAVFSRRLLLREVPISRYEDSDGNQKALVLDRNYTDVLAMMHPDWMDDAWEWESIGRIRARVISPLDLAVSKVARYTGNDEEDIAQLAMAGLIKAGPFIERCKEAEGYYIGDMRFVRHNIKDAADHIDTWKAPSRFRNVP